jgi:hypothetical protein
MLIFEAKARPACCPRHPNRALQARIVPLDRSLNPQERDIAQWLLEHADLDATHFIPSLTLPESEEYVTAVGLQLTSSYRRRLQQHSRVEVSLQQQSEP